METQISSTAAANLAPAPVKPSAWLSTTRVLLGLIFTWAFFDKLLGLGFATKDGKAWIDGVSPTTGFLTYATKGPLADLFSGLAGSVVVDWLYMLGVLLVGLCLLFGVGLRVASRAGALMMILFYLAALWPANNPIVDEHLVFLAVLMAIGAWPDVFGGLSLHRWWTSLPLVQRNRWIE